MKILSTAALSGLETSARIFSTVIVVKIIAVSAGPEGIATFGQFQNIFAIASVFCAGAFSTGLVVEIARYLRDANAQSTIFGHAINLALAISSIACVAVLLLSQYITKYAVLPPLYQYFIVLTGFAMLFVSINAVFLSFLNGSGQIREYILLKMIGNLLFLTVGVILTYLYSTVGAIIALLTSPALVTLFGLKYIKLPFSNRQRPLFSVFRKETFATFAPFWLMAVASGIASPAIYVLCRILIESKLSWNDVGLFEASLRVAEFYLLFLGPALSVYYVPRLSQCESINEEKKLMTEVFIATILFSLPILITLLMQPHFFVNLFFSNDFKINEKVVEILCISSFIKSMSWPLSFHMLVNKKIFWFIVAEGIYGISIYGASVYFIETGGLIGVAKAFLSGSSLYFFTCLFYYVLHWRDFSNRQQESN